MPVGLASRFRTASTCVSSRLLFEGAATECKMSAESGEFRTPWKRVTTPSLQSIHLSLYHRSGAGAEAACTLFTQSRVALSFPRIFVGGPHLFRDSALKNISNRYRHFLCLLLTNLFLLSSINFRRLHATPNLVDPCAKVYLFDYIYINAIY